MENGIKTRLKEYLSDFSTRRPPWNYLVSSFVSQSVIRGVKIHIWPTIPKLNSNTFEPVLNSINIRRRVQKLGDVTDRRSDVWTAGKFALKVGEERTNG